MSDEIRTVESYEEIAQAPEEIRFGPWTAQNIVFELLRNWMEVNSPASLGIPLKYKFDRDFTKSDILLEVAYKYDASTASKRPAIYIGRGDISMTHPTMGGVVVANYPESEESKMTICTVPLTVTVIGSPVLMAELLMEYVKIPLLQFQQVIQTDFGLRRFRVRTISKPALYPESKDFYTVTLGMEIVYDEGWILKGNDLKLKTVGWNIFTGLQANVLI